MIDVKEIDELVNKLEDAKTALASMEKITGECRYLTTKDVAKILGVSEASAREYMNRPDFPLLKVGKSLKVNSWAFLLYNMQARI